MQRPSVTTIVPVRNGARYLVEALDSLRAELRADDEVVVVDDGSTDESAELAARWSGPVRVLRQSTSGPAAARNRGLAEARGEWIAFLDADDVALSHRLAHLGPHLQGTDAADLVYGGQRRFVSPECVPAHAPVPPEKDEPVALIVGAMLTRRSVFERVGKFNTDLRSGELVEWFARVRAAGLCVVEAPGVVFRRRRHDNNLSNDPRFRAEMLSAVRQAIAARRPTVP